MATTPVREMSTRPSGVMRPMKALIFSGLPDEFCRENQIAAQLMNAGSIFYMHFQREPIATSRDVLKNNPEWAKAIAAFSRRLSRR